MRYSLLSLILVLFLFPATGCHGDSAEMKPVYERYQFDPKVIEKLPVYDSLAAAIIERSAFFHGYINSNDSYRAYRYMPFSKEEDGSKKLPAEVAPKIDHYFTALGKDFIYGFDVFKDSTIKIYIRRTTTENAFIDIEENLSWYPAGDTIRRREYPDKDSILNEHWQYWSRFNKRGLF